MRLPLPVVVPGRDRPAPRRIDERREHAPVEHARVGAEVVAERQVHLDAVGVPAAHGHPACLVERHALLPMAPEPVAPRLLVGRRQHRHDRRHCWSGPPGRPGRGTRRSAGPSRRATAGRPRRCGPAPDRRARAGDDRLPHEALGRGVDRDVVPGDVRHGAVQPPQRAPRRSAETTASSKLCQTTASGSLAAATASTSPARVAAA